MSLSIEDYQINDWNSPYQSEIHIPLKLPKGEVQIEWVYSESMDKRRLLIEVWDFNPLENTSFTISHLNDNDAHQIRDVFKENDTMYVKYNGTYCLIPASQVNLTCNASEEYSFYEITFVTQAAIWSEALEEL